MTGLFARLGLSLACAAAALTVAVAVFGTLPAVVYAAVLAAAANVLIWAV